MAVDIVEDFEGGTNGAVITTSNTGLGFTDGVATFTNTGGVHTGSLAALYSATAGTSYSVVYFGAPTLRGASYARFYVTFAALPAANVLIGAYRAVTTSRAELRINSAGTVTLRNGTTAVYTSTATLAANTTYRIEWDAVNGTGQAVRVYVGDSTTALISSGNQTYNTGTHTTPARTTACPSASTPRRPGPCASTTSRPATTPTPGPWAAPHTPLTAPTR